MNARQHIGGVARLDEDPRSALKANDTRVCLWVALGDTENGHEDDNNPVESDDDGANAQHWTLPSLET